MLGNKSSVPTMCQVCAQCLPVHYLPCSPLPYCVHLTLQKRLRLREMAFIFIFICVCMCVCVCVCVCVWFWGLHTRPHTCTLARQVLYRLSHAYPQSLFALVIFQVESQDFLQGWSQTFIFLPAASLSWDNRCMPPHPIYWLRWDLITLCRDWSWSSQSPSPE
jgi:hypothetical protein